MKKIDDLIDEVCEELRKAPYTSRSDFLLIIDLVSLADALRKPGAEAACLALAKKGVSERDYGMYLRMKSIVDGLDSITKLTKPKNIRRMPRIRTSTRARRKKPRNILIHGRKL